MNCREWEERIALAAGGDLDGAGRTELDRHLSMCAQCRDFARSLADSLDEMRAAHTAEIASAHFAAVRARVLAALRLPSRRITWRGIVWRGLIAACAAVAVLAPIAVVRLDQPLPPPPRVAPARPAAPSLAIFAAPRPVPQRHVRRRKSPYPPEPLLVKIETDNPDVVIYWIAN